MYGLDNIWKSMQKNLNIEKIIFKVVQIKFLAMHINNQKWQMHTTKFQSLTVKWQKKIKLKNNKEQKV